MRRLGALVLVALVALPGVSAEEVVETHEDGSLKAKYAVDAQGRKSGTCVEYWPNGKVARRAFYSRGLIEGSERTFDERGKTRTQALYRHGLLHGRYLGWDENGKATVVASYADGKLDGKRELFREGRAVSIQAWRRGELVSVDGVNASTRSQDEVLRTIAAILDGNVPGGPGRKGQPAGPDASTDRVVALRRLMAYRYLCGLPYAELTLGDEQNRLADAAARICARLGELTHEPRNPGLPEAEYKAGALGARNCNLGLGTAAAASVDGYMDDSDPTNIDRLGHRRWCLNPPMRVTGFGTTTGEDGRLYTAMWATDGSGADVPRLEAVCYPPPGFVPADFFGPGHAWSVSFAAGRIAAPAAVKVAVFELDADHVRAAAPLETDYFRVREDPGALPQCVIFRPKGIRTEPGATYWVEISCPDPKARKGHPDAFRYLVQFAPRVREAPPAQSPK